MLLRSSGSVDETLLLCHGISIGITSAVISNKKEVNKLKELLIHTENLAQDLQDEIEMNDSLTVKDLPDENFEPQNTRSHSFKNKALTACSPPLKRLWINQENMMI